MSKVLSFLWSNIGLKVVMAVSGILLCLFLLAHVAGNLIILFDVDAFNLYAYTLTKNKLLLYTAEAGLIGIVGAHITAAVILGVRNRAARKSRYMFKTNSGLSRRRWWSSNMVWTGLAVVIFLIYHLIHFKFGPYYETVQDGVVMRDLAGVVISEFKQPLDVAIYVIAMWLIGFHLLHGVRSLFATLGLETHKTACAINLSAKFFVFAVMGGFTLIPLLIFLGVR